MSDLSALKEKHKDFLTEDAIKYYSIKHSLDREEAILKLIANFEKESNSVDARAIALKAMSGIRLMSPKVTGIEQREKDLWYEIRQLKGQVSGLENNIKKILEKLDEPEKSRVFTWILNKFKNFLLKKGKN